MSDQEYAELAMGNNSGDIVTRRVRPDLIHGGYDFAVYLNGKLQKQGWRQTKREAESRVSCIVQRYEMTGEFNDDER